MSEFTRGPAYCDDLLTTTLDKYRKGLQENWEKSNAVLKLMKKSGNVKFEDGGNTIVEDLEYDDNVNVAWVAKTDPVAVTDNNILTQAKFSWAVIAGGVTIYDHDLAKNAGASKIHDMMDVKIKNLEASINAGMESALVAAVAASTKYPWSLLDIIDSADPSIADLGDIDRDSYTWWCATETASGSMATQGLEDIRTAFHTVSRGMMDPVNLMVTTQTLYTAYQARLTPYERLGSKNGDLEFETLTFANKPIVYSELTASGMWLGLNTKYLKLTINSNMHFKNQPFVRAQGGQSQAAIVQTMCQMTTNRPASMFKLTGMTA